jgi:serine/threonine protein kinase
MMERPKAKRQLFAAGNENDPFASNRPAKTEHVVKAEIHNATPPQLSMFMDVKMWEYDRRKCRLSARCKVELEGDRLTIKSGPVQQQRSMRILSVDLPGCHCTPPEKVTSAGGYSSYSFDLYSPNLKMRFKFSIIPTEPESQSIACERAFLHQQLAPLRERLTTFYKKVNAQKLPIQQKVLDRYDGKEPELNQALASQYGCDLTSLSPGVRAAALPERINNFFLIHNPSKRCHVHKLVAKFSGHEAALNDEFSSKYNVDLTVLDAAKNQRCIPLLDLLVWVKHLQTACRPRLQPTSASCTGCNGRFSHKVEKEKSKNSIFSFGAPKTNVGKPVHCLCCGGSFCAKCTASRCSLPFLYYTKPVQCCATCNEQQQLFQQVHEEAFESEHFKKVAGFKLSPGMTVCRNAVQFKQRFELGQLLGKGAFSEVRCASPRNLDATRTSASARAPAVFATKCIIKAGMKQKHVVALLNELRGLKQLQAHPNICKFYGFFDEDAVCFLLMEKVNGGTLLNWATSQAAGGISHTERQLRDILVQACGALAYCHQHGYVHRDVKPENLLVYNDVNTHRSSPNWKCPSVKLADFGLCKYLTPGKKVEQFCGTLEYMAPEVVGKRPTDFKADVWSMGVLMHLFLSGSQPFEVDREATPSLGEFAAQVQNGVSKNHWKQAVWKNVSANGMDLLQRMLCVNVDARLTMAQVLEHPWMKMKIKPNSPSTRPVPACVLKALHAAASKSMQRVSE